MIYGSVCSGIEAATQAWHPLGWKPAFFSEIEKFPSEVLAHHYGSNMTDETHSANGVPNYGDMTGFKEWPDHDQNSTKPIDVLVGGTPCQSFSIAGLRKGLSDPRGNLMLTYLSIARRYQPKWVVWENVPGVLSSFSGAPEDEDIENTGWEGVEESDFASFLRGLEECGYSPAWRVLDAQFTRTCGFEQAVPQRRRRLFVVGYLGDWRRAAAVLFDGESMSGNPAPRRETGQAIASETGRSVAGGSHWNGSDVHPSLNQSNNEGGIGQSNQELFSQGGSGLVAAPVASTLNAAFGNKLGLEDQHVNAGCPLFVAHTLLGKSNDSHAADLETYVAHTLKGEGFDASEDGTGRGTPIVPVAFNAREDTEVTGDRTGSLSASLPQSQAVAFSSKDFGGDAVEGVSPTLRAANSNESHQNAGAPPAVAYNNCVDVSDTIAVGANQTTGFKSPEVVANDNYAVRRLTPKECERLQGFPDNFTQIPRGKKTAEQCPDGPRYKALGNSMAVNVMRYLGERIQFVEELSNDLAA